MTGHFFTYKKSQLYYRKSGNGPKLLFCFHGYGRDSYTFSFLDEALGKAYTIIAIDSPYHGKTKWDDPVFRPADLAHVLLALAADNNSKQQRFSLLGFSMGGRIALNLAQYLAPHIERVVLLAPDGLKFNFWHWFSTHTWVGNKLFDYTVHHPAWLLKVVRFAEKANIITRNLATFVRYYLEDTDERLVLYRRWIIMKKFRPRLPLIKKLIARHKIKVRMLFGNYDRIIHSAGGHAFLKSIEEFATVKVIDAGHDVLRHWHAKAIANLFND